MNPKDRETGLAVAFGMLKELAGHATGSHWHRRFREGASRPETCRSIYFPTMLIADIGNAPGEPKAVWPANFAGMAAEMLRAYCMTELGPKLESQAADFQTAAMEPAAAGEPRCGRSLGLAEIHLDRERLYRFALAKMTSMLLSRSLEPLAADTIHRDVRAFCESRRVVEGGRVHQLSDRLLEQSPGPHEYFGIGRFRNLYHGNTAGFRGFYLVDQAPRQLQLALRQIGNAEVALAARAEDLLRSLVSDAERRIGELMQDQAAGATAAKQWADAFVRIGQNMAAEAARDTAIFEQRRAELHARVTQFQNAYWPALRRHNWIYKLVKKGAIELQAEDYRRSIEEFEVARMRLGAHQRAVQLLNALVGALKELLAKVQVAIDTITAERDTALAEIERISAHRPDYACPVGLPLIAGADDLEAFYARLLPDGGEVQVLSDAHARLLAAGDLLAVATGEPARFHDAIRNSVAPSFESRVEELHVADELRRRFPDPEQLGGVLRERVRESFEAVQLRPHTEQEHGLHLVRLLGIDTARMGTIPDVLAQFDYQRGTRFETVHINDPERIYLLQYRAVFSLRDVANFTAARAAYDRASERLRFERFHVFPGERSLPAPGDRLTGLQARTVALKAWVIGILVYGKHDGALYVRPVDEPPLPLGANLELFRNREGYRRAVDVLTQFACYHQEHGPDSLHARLRVLRAVHDGRVHDLGSAEAKLSALLDDEVFAQVEAELEWWRRNTVPAATAWEQTNGSSNGTGDRVRPEPGQSRMRR